MCRGGEFDLSFESLTSHEARRALRELPITDPALFAEISQPRSCVGVVPSLTPDEALLEDNPPDEGAEDDSDVPFAEVCAHHYESLNTSPLDPAQIYLPNETGGLTSTAGSESILVEAVDDVVVNVTPDVTASGRGRRVRRKNVLYNGKWWHDHQDEGVDEDFDVI